MNRRLQYILNIFILTLVMTILGCHSGEEKETAEKCIEEGNKALAERDWNLAASRFTRSLELSPDNKSILYSRAAAWLAQAKDKYNLATAAAGRGDVVTAEADAKSADEIFGHASKDISRLIELDSNYTDAYYLRGCIELYTGDWNAAVETFSICIKQKPDWPFAWQRRGEVYGYIGDTANATVDLKKAAELGYVDTRVVPGADKNKEESKDVPQSTSDKSVKEPPAGSNPSVKPVATEKKTPSTDGSKK